jgi:hypothetical protein
VADESRQICVSPLDPVLASGLGLMIGLCSGRQEDGEHRRTPTYQRAQERPHERGPERSVRHRVNANGHENTSHMRRHVSKSGSRSPASISRYSRTVTPISHAARQTRSPSRLRSRSIIVAWDAKVAMRVEPKPGSLTL